MYDEIYIWLRTSILTLGLFVVVCGVICRILPGVVAGALKMESFLPEPRDRLDVPIISAIEAKNFKQALKLVEKRLSKKSGPTSDDFLYALKIYIKSCHPSVQEKSSAFVDIKELAQLPIGKAFATVEILQLFDESLKVLFPKNKKSANSIIGSLRGSATRALPKDEKLAKACFRGCLERFDMENAQLIAKSLSTNFPSNRDYPFWDITATWMLSRYGKERDCVVLESIEDVVKSTEGVNRKLGMYGNLAAMQIKKIAEQNMSRVGGEVLAKSIQTPQELLVLHAIVRSGADGSKSLLRYTDNQYLGPYSATARGNWALQRLHLQMLVDTQAWEKLFGACKTLLTNAQPERKDEEGYDPRGSDWFVWECFVRAVREMGTISASDSFAAQREAHLLGQTGRSTYERNVHLGALEYDFYNPSNACEVRTDGVNHPTGFSTKTSSLLSYVVSQKYTPSLFHDIRPYVMKLGLDEQRYLLGKASAVLKSGSSLPSAGEDAEDNTNKKTKFITASITISKLEYLLKGSLAESRRSPHIPNMNNRKAFDCDWCGNACAQVCHHCLVDLAKQSLSCYSAEIDDPIVAENLLPTDMHPADEWLIIASMCLIKLSGVRPLLGAESETLSPKVSTQRILQAIAILEYGASRSKPNPQFSMLLIRLYSRMGAGSLAVRAYHRLGIKQIQGDTLSYLLIDRISSFHPHPVSNHTDDASTEIGELGAYIEKCQGFYRRWRFHVSRNIFASFETGSYDSVVQLLDVAEVLSHSVAAAMMVVELRRMRRLTDPGTTMYKTTQGLDILPGNPAKQEYLNNCDYKSFPNYEGLSQDPFEAYTRLGPPPSSIRCKSFLAIENLWTYLKPTTQPLKSSRHVQRTYTIHTLSPWILTQDDYTKASQSMTSFEFQLVNISESLTAIIRKVCNFNERSKIETDSPSTAALEHSQQTLDFLDEIELRISVFVDGDIGLIPSFGSILHPLYTAHEISSLLLSVSESIRRPDLESLYAIDVAASLEKMGKKIQSKVKMLAAQVIKLVTETPMLDYILSQIQFKEIQFAQGAQFRDSKKAKGGDFSDPNMPEKDEWDDIGKEIKRVCDKSEYFLEFHAGEVVDSWRESVMGLTCLK